ncbi:MAG: hypothetical protein MUE42_04240 [Opitutaceae bacterium]|jgi:hypothetical protein|nr:hypothetical protein [Opitutaceae bacterium]
MSDVSFSDEPVLVKPSASRDWKRWLLIAVALAVVGSVIYVPIGKARMEESAHHAERGTRQGALYHLTIEGVAHTLELTWTGRGNFAPVLTPAPAAGTVLHLEARPGKESLAWNSQIGAFGPTSFAVDPYAHFKLRLRLEREGRTLWRDTLMAYGVHDTHGHDH